MHGPGQGARMGSALVWVPFVLIVALAAVLGYRHGLRHAGLSETEAIARAAARYAEEAGPGVDPHDCAAWPGQGGDWLVVGCGPVPFDAARHREYRIDRTGRIALARGPADWARGARPLAPP